MRGFSYNRFFKFHKYGYLGIGMSAANMAYELAYLLGFKRIVLIGQDLAYGEDGTSHAKGHVYGEKEVKFKETDEYVTKYGGDGVVRSSKVWIMFKNFFEKDIYDASLNGVVTINATEGGARIEGSIEMPFKEVIEKYVTKNKKTKIKLRKPRKDGYKKKLQKAYKKVLKMIEIGEKVKKDTEKLFLEVAKAFDELVELNKRNELEKIDFKKLQRLSDKIDKLKEKIESKTFLQCYGETIVPYLANKETDLAKIHVQNPKTEIERIISSLQQTKSMLDPFIKSNWMIKSMIENDFYDPFQMRMEYKID
jgi:hypothetical protein